MTDVEERLRDAFRAVDAQTTVPPMRTPTRHVPLRWVAAAAAALAILGAATYLTTDRDNVVAVDVQPERFDDLADTICARVLREWHVIDPRFATSEAYLLSARARTTLVDSAIVSFTALPDARDDARLRTRVLDLLAEAGVRAGLVERLAARGEVDAAIDAWPNVDEYIGLALTLLAEHGATGCRP